MTTCPFAAMLASAKSRPADPATTRSPGDATMARAISTPHLPSASTNLGGAEGQDMPSPSAPSTRLNRRQLRQLGRCWTLEEVRQHARKDDAWIAVDGQVFDITDHILTHSGWQDGSISTVLSIIAHAGTDCSQEFREIHRPYPVAWKQLRAYYIGDLAATSEPSLSV